MAEQPLIGYYVKVERDGKVLDLDISQLTNEELHEYAIAHPFSGWTIAKILLKWIKENVEV